MLSQHFYILIECDYRTSLRTNPSQQDVDMQMELHSLAFLHVAYVLANLFREMGLILMSRVRVCGLSISITPINVHKR